MGETWVLLFAVSRCAFTNVEGQVWDLSLDRDSTHPVKTSDSIAVQVGQRRIPETSRCTINMVLVWHTQHTSFNDGLLSCVQPCVTTR